MWVTEGKSRENLGLGLEKNASPQGRGNHPHLLRPSYRQSAQQESSQVSPRSRNLGTSRSPVENRHLTIKEPAQVKTHRCPDSHFADWAYSAGHGGSEKSALTKAWLPVHPHAPRQVRDKGMAVPALSGGIMTSGCHIACTATCRERGLHDR